MSVHTGAHVEHHDVDDREGMDQSSLNNEVSCRVAGDFSFSNWSLDSSAPAQSCRKPVESFP